MISWDVQFNGSYVISFFNITLFPFGAESYSVNASGTNTKQHALESLTAGQSYVATVQSVSAGGAPSAFSAVSDPSHSHRTGEFVSFLALRIYAFKNVLENFYL